MESPARQLARFDAAVAAGLVPDAGIGAPACSVCPIAFGLSGIPAELPAPGGPGAVYLLHFTTPFGHARHYLGWASVLTDRLRDHFRGNGASAGLLKAAWAAGVRFACVRWWPGDRHLEALFKYHGPRQNDGRAVIGRHGARVSLARYCPRCCQGNPGRTIQGVALPTTGWTERRP
jgi:hypothetical protein